MSLKKVTGRVYIVYQECDTQNCTGQYVKTGKVWVSNPVLFDHKCNECGSHKHFEVQYPHNEAIADSENIKDELKDK